MSQCEFSITGSCSLSLASLYILPISELFPAWWWRMYHQQPPCTYAFSPGSDVVILMWAITKVGYITPGKYCQFLSFFAVLYIQPTVYSLLTVHLSHSIVFCLVCAAVWTAVSGSSVLQFCIQCFQLTRPHTKQWGATLEVNLLKTEVFSWWAHKDASYVINRIMWIMSVYFCCKIQFWDVIM